MPRRYSLSFLTCLNAPPPEAVRNAAAADYDFVGLRLLPASPGGIAFRLMDEPAMLLQTLASLRETGVEVFDVEIVRIGPDFSAPDCSAFLDTAARIGARSILVVGDDADEARLTASFAALCQAAQPYGLSADLEFMPQSEVHDAKAAMRILTGARQPNAAVIVDALHVSRSRTSLADVAAIPRNCMNYVQICDGPAAIPTSRDGLNHAARCERLLPGEGAIDLTGLFAVLPAELPVSVEVPNDKQALLLGPLEWARRARTCSEAVLAKVDASRSSP